MLLMPCTRTWYLSHKNHNRSNAVAGKVNCSYAKYWHFQLFSKCSCLELANMNRREKHSLVWRRSVQCSVTVTMSLVQIRVQPWGKGDFPWPLGWRTKAPDKQGWNRGSSMVWGITMETVRQLLPLLEFWLTSSTPSQPLCPDSTPGSRTGRPGEWGVNGLIMTLSCFSAAFLQLEQERRQSGCNTTFPLLVL